MKKSILLVFLTASAILAPCAQAKAIFTCGSKDFDCPNGEVANVGLCWEGSSLGCQTCHSIQRAVESDCTLPKVCDIEGRIDGCSAPGILHGPVTKVFGSSCDIHDMCYATPGETKANCDNDFHANNHTICEFPGIGSILRIPCHEAATTIYAAVALHPDAEDGYEGGQRYAKSQCVPYEIVVQGACMDIEGTSNGSNVIGNGTPPSCKKAWVWHDPDEEVDGHTNIPTSEEKYQIRHVSGKCLDASAGVHTKFAPGTNVQVWDCVPGNDNPNQHWQKDQYGRYYPKQNPKVCLFFDEPAGYNIQLETCPCDKAPDFASESECYSWCEDHIPCNPSSCDCDD